jgi:hypothetical protein
VPEEDFCVCGKLEEEHGDYHFDDTAHCGFVYARFVTPDVLKIGHSETYERAWSKGNVFWVRSGSTAVEAYLQSKIALGGFPDHWIGEFAPLRITEHYKLVNDAGTCAHGVENALSVNYKKALISILNSIYDEAKAHRMSLKFLMEIFKYLECSCE